MKTAFGRFFVALLVYALILVRERLVLGGIRPIAAISQSQKQKSCNQERFFVFGLPGQPQDGARCGMPDRFALASAHGNCARRRWGWVSNRLLILRVHVLVLRLGSPLRWRIP